MVWQKSCHTSYFEINGVAEAVSFEIGQNFPKFEKQFSEISFYFLKLDAFVITSLKKFFNSKNTCAYAIYCQNCHHFMKTLK